MAHIQSKAMTQSRGVFHIASALLALVLSLLHHTESHCMDNSNPSAGPRAGVSSYFLTPEEQEKLLSKAEAGDAEAALRLSRYYSFIRLDREKGRHWLTRAAQGGHVLAQYSLAVALRSEGKDLSEAAHWAAEALRNGDEEAGELLRQIEAARAGNGWQPNK